MELAGLKTYGLILEKEFENLNLALMLSHFGLRVVDTGEPAVQGRPTPRRPGHSQAPATSRLVCKAEAQRLPCLLLTPPLSPHVRARCWELWT